MSKRCMTVLDDETAEQIEALKKREQRTESQMIAVLVKEAISAREKATA